MTAEQVKNRINTILGEQHSSQVYLVLKQGDTWSVKLADIEDDRAEPEVRRMFGDYIRNCVAANDDLQVCNLSETEERANAIYLYDYDNYPEELGIFKTFNISTPENPIPKFNFREDDLGTLYGYIIYLGSMQDGLMLFKKHYPISLIKRDSFLLGVIPAKERFEMVSGEDIIRLNGTAQLLQIDGELYIMDLKMLERNMGFTELIKKAAADSVSAIETLDILEDIEMLKESLGEISFTRKLSKVRQASPIFRLGIPAETIINFTKTTDALRGKFKYNDDGTKIRLTTKRSKDYFLKLMNDAFLRSELTQQYYEASAKDNITAE